MNHNPENQQILTVAQMEKTREKGGTRFTLRVPSFTVSRGEFLAVVGPSGCGKSTFLDMLGLVLQPDEAEIFSFYPRYRGKVVGFPLMNRKESQLAILRSREIGYVLQSGGLLPYLSVEDNILLPCRLNNYPEDKCLERARAIAQRLGIDDQLNKKPAFLSGGQRQRVAIARALVHQPHMILADEPTAAVDQFTAIEIRDSFRAIAQSEGIGLVMVTHDRNLVNDCADTMVTFAVERLSPSYTVSTLIRM